jgi:hypothetical protein
VNGIEIATKAATGTILGSTGAVRIGGNAVWGEYFRGNIDEVRIYNRALSLAEIQTDMSTPIGTTGTDVVAPTVAVTAPAAGATVSGPVTVAASASDNVGVVGVQFLVNGALSGAEATTQPYAMVWNTTGLKAGAYTIEAVARDAAGNTKKSAAISVNVVAPTAAAVVGQWSAAFSWPIVGVHQVMLRTGEVLSFEQTFAGGAYLWNPTTGQFTHVPVGTNTFCAGHALLADGRVLVVGGHSVDHVGLNVTNIFDPVTRTWTSGPTMSTQRWYPTTTTLPDGRALIVAGEVNCAGCNAQIPEIFDPVANTITQLPAASFDFPWYPHNFVLADGRILAAGAGKAPIASQVLDLQTQTWSVVDPVPYDGASSVMYLPGRFMKTGTAIDPNLPARPAGPNTYVLDMSAATPAWRETPPMVFPRAFVNVTALPDGSVLATGGGPTTDPMGLAAATLEAELWSPTTETWSTMSRMHTPRLYHGNALLIPDGRVLVASGGRLHDFADPTYDQLNAELFSPPYLFKGARPVISSAPASAAYGSAINVQTADAASITAVSLVRMGSVTHAFNPDQRFIPLSFTTGAGQLSVAMPANANLAPPGYYMLFILNGAGVPSVAAIIRMG